MKIFNEQFRMETYYNLKRVGEEISNRVPGIVQNSMPVTSEDLEYFNITIDKCINELTEIKKSINDNFTSKN